MMSLKNKSKIFFAFNIILLLLLLTLSFPLYNLISKISGYNQITEISDNDYVKDSSKSETNKQIPQIIDRKMTIEFLAEVNESLSWEVRSLEDIIELNIGESRVIKFEGKNISNETIVATADFIAQPEKILPYLIKTECFCFTEQSLEPGQSQIFTMIFFLDPSLDQDLDLEEIKNLTFTYKFSKHIS